jgi:hypothetical protein
VLILTAEYFEQTQLGTCPATDDADDSSEPYDSYDDRDEEQNEVNFEERKSVEDRGEAELIEE